MAEAPALDRIKRLKLRSWRRGIKEMDLILGPFADARLAQLSPQVLDAYEAMLVIDDQTLYSWFSGRVEVDPRHLNVVAMIREFHGI